MADEHSKCGNCLYFRDDQIMGICRFFPQQINKHFKDWCGQHKPYQPKMVALPVVEMPEPTQVAKVKRKYTRKEAA